MRITVKLREHYSLAMFAVKRPGTGAAVVDFEDFSAPADVAKL
jgi:hypothetical protein